MIDRVVFSKGNSINDHTHMMIDRVVFSKGNSINDPTCMIIVSIDREMHALDQIIVSPGE